MTGVREIGCRDSGWEVEKTTKGHRRVKGFRSLRKDPEEEKVGDRRKLRKNEL